MTTSSSGGSRPDARAEGSPRLRVAVWGASGLAGAEVLRLLLGHPAADVVAAGAGRHAGQPVASVCPQLAAVVGNRTFDPLEPATLDGADVVISALPHEETARRVPDLLELGLSVVDLSGAFRLPAPLYPEVYGFVHPAPTLLAEAAIGLPELWPVGPTNRLVAVPGCYVTAATLAIRPLLSTPHLTAGATTASPVVVDAASGVSGAGREPTPETTFCAVDEDFRAYGLLQHRHRPEIRARIGAEVLFTPHLAPMQRGILVTGYVPPELVDTDDPLGRLQQAYAGRRFVHVSEVPPSTRATVGSNACHLSARRDPTTGWTIALGALDNLVKGAAGQAVQCANLLVGLPEEAGLSAMGTLS